MRFIVLVLGIIFMDQLSKYMIETHMELGMSLPLLPDIFHITYILNPGAAFGILENQRWFFILIAVLLLVIVGWLYPKLKAEHRVMRFGVALLVGGAVGNLIDRVKTGYVVDFFDFRIWPIFNIADIAIVIGVVFILFVLFFLAEKKDACDERK